MGLRTLYGHNQKLTPFAFCLRLPLLLLPTLSFFFFRHAVVRWMPLWLDSGLFSFLTTGLSFFVFCWGLLALLDLVRARLRDLRHSGWALLWFLIPLVNLYWTFKLFLKPFQGRTLILILLVIGFQIPLQQVYRNFLYAVDLSLVCAVAKDELAQDSNAKTGKLPHRFFDRLDVGIMTPAIQDALYEAWATNLDSFVNRFSEAIAPLVQTQWICPVLQPKSI